MPRWAHNKHELSGQKFGKLLVVSRVESRGGKSYWKCKCDCGNSHTVAGTHLKNKAISDCGCGKKARFTEFATKHGHSKKPEFQVWADMHKRCTNPKDRAYKNYGARGIKVCERWSSFENFYEDLGPRPHNHELDRVDNEGDYTPENCRWTTHSNNCRNTRRTVKVIFNGEETPLVDLAEKFGINKSTLYYRVTRLGWSLDRSLGLSP